MSLAWIPDRSMSIRGLGKTAEGSALPLRLPNGVHVTLIDTPGRREYIKSAICRMWEADAALIVVEPSGFEAAASHEGILAELLLLTYSIGMQHVAVVVNRWVSRN